MIAALYVGPVQKYLHVRRELAPGAAASPSLDRQHRRLHDVEAQLHTRPTIVCFARACGWIFPGEQADVVDRA